MHYIENSNDVEAQKAKGDLVKHIHKRVIEVKNDNRVEVEYMTLLERDREKMEEARLKDAENFLRLGVSEEIVAKGTELPIEKVREIRKKIMN